MANEASSKLATCALRTGLIEECKTVWATNTILETLKLDSSRQRPVRVGRQPLFRLLFGDILPIELLGLFDHFFGRYCFIPPVKAGPHGLDLSGLGLSDLGPGRVS